MGAPSRWLSASMIKMSPFLAIKEYQSRSRRWSMRPAISHGTVTSWAVSALAWCGVSSTTGAFAKASSTGFDDMPSRWMRYSKPSNMPMPA